MFALPPLDTLDDIPDSLLGAKTGPRAVLAP